MVARFWIGIRQIALHSAFQRDAGQTIREITLLAECLVTSLFSLKFSLIAWKARLASFRQINTILLHVLFVHSELCETCGFFKKKNYFYVCLGHLYFNIFSESVSVGD